MARLPAVMSSTVMSTTAVPLVSIVSLKSRNVVRRVEPSARVPGVLGQVVARQQLAQTGVESTTLTIVGTALLLFGATLSVAGVALARWEF